MSIPPLLPCGLLPHGVFDCTLDEVAANYTWSPRRAELWEGFGQFLAWLKPQPAAPHLYLDGGFTGDKQHPKDIDVVLDLATADDDAFRHWLVVFATQRPLIAEQFLVDFWIYHPTMANDLRGFFHYIRPEEAQARGVSPDHRKGLLRIAL